MQVAALATEAKRVRNEFYSQTGLLITYLVTTAFIPAVGIGYIVVAPLIACRLVSVGTKHRHTELANWSLAFTIFGYVLAAASTLFWIRFLSDPNVSIPK